MGYTIDIDTGGTFTDGFFVLDEHVETVKVPTTPHDLTICFLDCVRAGAKRFGIPIEDLLYETDIIRFSNTIGTNTIIQRDGSKIGLLVSAGCENLAPTRTENGKAPLVLPDMVIGLDEEVSTNGDVIKAPDKQAAMTVAQSLIDQGGSCLVVAFANSEFNSANERLVRQIVKNEYPRDFLGSVPVFLSSDISRRSGEAERINAGVLNAYIHAKLVRLLYKAGEELRKRLYRRNLFIVHNNGAVARVAKTRAINTYNSGPVAGLLGARLIGQIYGVDDLISMDMGGTSFDVGYVRMGQASYTLNPDVEGLPVNLPMHAIRAIGAGGGSIASVTAGKVQVGPKSAGALPGPACFDLGGIEPTVTDADLILGVLDPDYFLGGTMKLNMKKAKEAIEGKVAKALGLSAKAAALAVKNTVDENMGMQIKALTDEFGQKVNPLLLVYGGAGPAHCCRVAEVAGIKKILVTPFSAIFSAFSSSSMDVGHLYYRRIDLPFDEKSDLSALSQPIEGMRREAQRDMRGEGFSPSQVIEELELFISDSKGQQEIKLTEATDFFMDKGKVKDIAAQARKALSSKGQVTLKMVGLMVQAPVPHYRVTETPQSEHPVESARRGSRAVFLDSAEGGKGTPVYEWAKLQNGHQILGPVVIESEHTTLLVRSGWKLEIDQYRHAILEEVS
ncbi:MAG: hydantoinase/oxoprolinase family protein [Desulfobacteraceae bacterium]|jgi:N-methylhydantoinase A/acetophenone carboxylase